MLQLNRGLSPIPQGWFTEALCLAGPDTTLQLVIG